MPDNKGYKNIHNIKRHFGNSIRQYIYVQEYMSPPLSLSMLTYDIQKNKKKMFHTFYIFRVKYNKLKVVETGELQSTFSFTISIGNIADVADKESPTRTTCKKRPSPN